MKKLIIYGLIGLFLLSFLPETDGSGGGADLSAALAALAAPVESNFSESRQERLVKVSNYWPPLLGINCAKERGDQCVSRVSGCKSWLTDDWSGKKFFCGLGNDWQALSRAGAAACPKSWPFGRQFRLPDGSVWTCVDRGPAIVEEGNVAWVDLMIPTPRYEFGEVVTAKIL